MRRGNQKINNNRYIKRRGGKLLLFLFAAAFALSGCAVDKLKELDVVYDLMQQDQRDAAERAANDGTAAAWEEAASESGGEAAQDERQADSGGSVAYDGSAGAAPEDGAALEEEDIVAAQEQMELAANKRSREEIEREDGEARQALGLTESRIADLMRENENNYYFRHLDDAGRRLYAELYHIIDARGEKIRVSSLDESEVDRAFQYLMADHPEIFYADGYTYTRYTIGGELIKLGFTARYVYDGEETERRAAQIADEVERIVAGAPVTDDQYELAKYVYDYIIDHTEYEIGAEDNQNICSVFLSGRSVCQGYAKAAQLLLNRLGVGTTLVTGTVSAGDRPSARHAWNLSNVNGRDYFLDTTWGDSSFQQAAAEETLARRINYDYLLDTTQDLMDTHTIDDLVEMPVCTHLEDNYYVRDGAYFTGADEEQFRALFDKAYAENRSALTLKCADEDVYRTVTKYLITDRGLFDYLRDPGNSASFASSDMQRTLTFLLG